MINTIETAPKKGDILLFVPNKGWLTGKWREEIKLENKTRIYGVWVDKNLFVVHPTHWHEMLPTPE